MPPRSLAAVVIALIAMIPVSVLHAQGPYALTTESLARAIADTRGAGVLQLPLVAAKLSRAMDPANGVNGLQFLHISNALPMTADNMITTIETRMKSAPFDISLLTPYIRAAVTSAEARRQFAPPPILTAAALNADGIIVSISASSNFMTAESIVNVVLSTDSNSDHIIRPYRVALEEQVVSNAVGATKTVKVGAFYFRLADFSNLPLTIHSVGIKSTVLLFVEERDLAF